MASIFRPSYSNQGDTRKSAVYHVRFRYLGVLRQLPGFRDQRATAELGRRLEQLAALRGTRASLPADLLAWVQRLEPRRLKKLAGWGLVDGDQVAAACSLSDHLAAFETSLLARGNTKRHVQQVKSHALRVFEGCGFKYWSDIEPLAVERYLATERKGED